MNADLSPPTPEPRQSPHRTPESRSQGNLASLSVVLGVSYTDVIQETA